MRRKPRFIRRFRKGFKRSASGKKKYLFKRVLCVPTVAVTDTFAQYIISQYFTLNSVPNYTEFTNLYDEYKMCGIKCKFVFDHDSSEMGAASTNLIPNLITINDWNSNNTCSSETVASQYQSFKVARMNRPITRYFKPRPLISSAGAGGERMQIGNPWVRTVDSSLQYYGLNSAFDGSQAGGTGINTLGNVKIYITYYMAFRDVN